MMVYSGTTVRQDTLEVGEGGEATHFLVCREQRRGRGQGVMQSPRITSNDIPPSSRHYFLQFQHLSKVYPVFRKVDRLRHEDLSPGDMYIWKHLHHMCFTSLLRICQSNQVDNPNLPF